MTKDNATMQQKLMRIQICIDLLIQDIDDPVKTPTKQTKKLQDKLNEAQELLIPILDKFSESNAVKKTHYFQEVQQKFLYIIDREYKRFFKVDLNSSKLR